MPAGTEDQPILIMKSPSLFLINDRTVDSSSLITALKKSHAQPNIPLIIEIPSNTPLETIKALTQRLATAGFKPVFKYPRHADAVIKSQEKPDSSTPPPPARKWRK